MAGNGRGLYVLRWAVVGVAILYSGAIFACRRCYRLAYRCQREDSYSRAMRRVNKIRHRLGWEPGILNNRGWKPKGMHWDTFDRLTAQHDALVTKSLAEMARQIGKLQKWVPNLD